MLDDETAALFQREPQPSRRELANRVKVLNLDGFPIPSWAANEKEKFLWSRFNDENDDITAYERLLSLGGGQHLLLFSSINGGGVLWSNEEEFFGNGGGKATDVSHSPTEITDRASDDLLYYNAATGQIRSGGAFRLFKNSYASTDKVGMEQFFRETGFRTVEEAARVWQAVVPFDVMVRVLSSPTLRAFGKVPVSCTVLIANGSVEE